MNNRIFIALKGMAMGMAEVVPGVSGGTIAFVTGIYERLINAIRRISTLPIKVWKQNGFRKFWSHIDGTFLIFLGLGMFAGLVIGIFGITYLLEHFPAPVWSFFFGLIVASAIYVGRKIKHWRLPEIIFLLMGTLIAYFITIASPAQGSTDLFMVFIAGVIAICAMILPGISGSFMLLLMGMYLLILRSARAALSILDGDSILIILVFICGCIVGLSLFSHLLHFLFRRFHFVTLAILTGFMVGSLNRIWPWRNPVLWLDKMSGDHVRNLPPGGSMDSFQVIREVNVWPAIYEGKPLILAVLLCFLVGLSLVFFLAMFATENEEKHL